MVTLGELDKADRRIEDWWTTFDVFGIALITILIAIPIGIYCDEFAYVGLVIVIGFICMVIACTTLDGSKKRRKIAHIKSRLLERERRKQAMMEKNKKKKKTKQKDSWTDEWAKFLKLDKKEIAKWKKTVKKEEPPAYLEQRYPPNSITDPDAFRDYYRNLDDDYYDDEFDDIDWDDYYDYLDKRDREEYESKTQYKPSSIREWLGGYLLASKAFDHLFGVNKKDKKD